MDKTLLLVLVLWRSSLGISVETQYLNSLEECLAVKQLIEDVTTVDKMRYELKAYCIESQELVYGADLQSD